MNENKYNPPLIILGAEPEGKVNFSDFMEVGEKSAKEKLEKPPYLRYMGWNLLTLDNATIRGSFWEVKNGERKTIRLFRDGSLVASAFADDDFLGWGGEHAEFLESPELNNLALIEYVYEFVNVYKEFIPFLGEVKQIRFKAAFKNIVVNGKNLFFTPGIRASGYFPFHNIVYKAQKDFSTEDIIVKLDSNNSYVSEHVAYLFLREIYANFGATEDKIPFIKTDEHGMKYLDSTQIKAIG